MLMFCPHCGTMLQLEVNDSDGSHIFACSTCPYIHTVRSTFKRTIYVEPKQVDDVLGGDDAWKNVDQTEAECPKCSNKKAYFMQIQIRSADEPMTLFFKCTKCKHLWREG